MAQLDSSPLEVTSPVEGLRATGVMGPAAEVVTAAALVAALVGVMAQPVAGLSPSKLTVNVEVEHYC